MDEIIANYKFKTVTSARFTPDDLEFLNSNADILFDDVERQLNARTAILHLAEKALSRKQVIKDTANADKVEELLNVIERQNAELSEFNDIKKAFKGYLIISRKFKVAQNYLELFKIWLTTLQGTRLKLWIMTQDDLNYVKQHEND